MSFKSCIVCNRERPTFKSLKAHLFGHTKKQIINAIGRGRYCKSNLSCWGGGLDDEKVLAAAVSPKNNSLTKESILISPLSEKCLHDNILMPECRESFTCDSYFEIDQVNKVGVGETEENVPESSSSDWSDVENIENEFRYRKRQRKCSKKRKLSQEADHAVCYERTRCFDVTNEVSSQTNEARIMTQTKATVSTHSQTEEAGNTSDEVSFHVKEDVYASEADCGAHSLTDDDNMSGEDSKANLEGLCSQFDMNDNVIMTGYNLSKSGHSAESDGECIQKAPDSKVDPVSKENTCDIASVNRQLMRKLKRQRYACNMLKNELRYLNVKRQRQRKRLDDLHKKISSFSSLTKLKAFRFSRENSKPNVVPCLNDETGNFYVCQCKRRNNEVVNVLQKRDIENLVSDTESSSDTGKISSFPVDDSKFYCNTCGNGYKTKGKLSEHIKSHNLHCMICDTRFELVALYKEHMGKHVLKVFVCHFCKGEYADKKMLLDHVDVHIDAEACENIVGMEQDYKLNSFSMNNNVTRSFRSHLSNSYFASNSFSTNQQVNTCWLYFCQICRRSYQNYANYYSHLQYHWLY